MELSLEELAIIDVSLERHLELFERNRKYVTTHINFLEETDQQINKLKELRIRVQAECKVRSTAKRL